MKAGHLLSTSPSHASAQIVVSSGGHTATAPAAGLVPLELALKRILVPFDFSKHAEKALQQALAVARQFGSQIVVANVIESFVYPGDYSRLPLPLDTWATDCQKENLARLKDLTKGSDVNVEATVRVGRPWEEIVRLAEEEKVDLIIISTHGYSGLKHVFLGSVAERVVRHAPCPVLTIRPRELDFQ